MKVTCKDCGEELSLHPEGAWVPKLDSGMGYSCRIRYGKQCDPDPPQMVRPKAPYDPYSRSKIDGGLVSYPDMNVA